MKGQLGTQVKDASLSELGNPSLDWRAGSKKGSGQKRRGRACRPQEERRSSRRGSSITCAR